MGSVSDSLRGRDASIDERGVSWSGGGGRSEESLIGGSASCVADERWDLRFGDEDGGAMVPEEEVFCNCGRSVEAKFLAAGLRGGVVSPGAGAKTIVFLHISHMPRNDVIACLQVLQIATVVEDAMSAFVNCCGVKPKSKRELPAVVGVGQGVFGEEFEP